MNQASRHRIEGIEAWFLAHEDGEFVVPPPDYSSVRIGDAELARTVVYTSKYPILPRIRNLSQLAPPIAVLGRYGLPTDADLPFLGGSSTNRLFIGDCDPPDILIFAWLREHFPIIWHGVNDEFLERHGIQSTDTVRIPLSDAERKSVTILSQLCPDYRTILGENCSALVSAGFKIELESATTHPTFAAQT